MERQVIFTNGYTDDIDSLNKEFRTDVLVSDDNGNYFAPQFITLNRIGNEFGNDQICYLDDNLVIMHEVTKDTILKSIPKLYKWLFYKRWQPLSSEQLEKYFSPKEIWVYFTVNVSESDR
jgi:hypothetical protein